MIGVGDGSGMFPISTKTGDFDPEMVEKFNALIADKGYGWKLPDIFPKNLKAFEPMSQCPSPVPSADTDILGLKIVPVVKEEK